MRNRLGGRPNFSSVARRQLRQDAHRLGMKHVDLCHRIPFKLIYDTFSSYLNKELSRKEFLKFIDLLFDQSSPPCSQKKEVLSLLKKTDLETNHKACRRILSILNSASANLRPGNSSFNRSIGARLDPTVVVSESGNVQFTPQSKRALKALREEELLPLTARKGHFRTSFFRAGQQTPVGQVITPERLTPHSLRLFSRAFASQCQQQITASPEQDDKLKPREKAPCSVARPLFRR